MSRGGCTPNMTRCAATCLHYLAVIDYRQERERQEQAAKQASNGYAEEYADYVRDNPLITFKSWLQWRKNAQISTT